MMEERKEREIAYYDGQAAHETVKQGEYSPVLGSHKFLYRLVAPLCEGRRVLDYGCGEGIHLPFLAEYAQEVVGIDLSEGALAIAKKRYEIQNTRYNIQLLKMDCEKMTFPDNSFDVIFDGGTFSSVDLKRAWSEMARVLKPDGLLIGIETFGHNPITNLKRRVNKLVGKRTAWAAEHILKMEDLKESKKYFGKVEVYYSHLISWLAFPFLNLPGGKFLLKSLEFIDKVLLEAPFLRKYSFKVVFIFSSPKK